MPAVVEELRRDHQNFENLLTVLEQEVAVFERSERPDYDVIEAVVRYFDDYSSRCHQPLEALILEKFTARDESAATAAGDLATGHAELGLQFRELASVIEEVVGGQDLPRAMLGRAVRRFAKLERRHIQMAEQTLLMPACKTLKDEDWREIEDRRSRGSDPLFGSRPAQEFAALSRRIVTWEQEDQAERELQAERSDISKG